MCRLLPEGAQVHVSSLRGLRAWVDGWWGGGLDDGGLVD